MRRFKSEGRTLRKIERVSPEWKDLAYSLYFSRSAVKAMAEENLGDAVVLRGGGGKMAKRRGRHATASLLGHSD